MEDDDEVDVRLGLAPDPVLPIGVLAERLGVGVATLRAWHDRDPALAPAPAATAGSRPAGALAGGAARRDVYDASRRCVALLQPLWPVAQVPG